MSSTIRPDTKLRKVILNSTKAEINLCYTCGSCAVECPVNIATSRLQPRKLVFMANLGLLDDLVHSPEIWYCQQCRRCSHVCPMTVKPADLINYLQLEAINRNVVTYKDLLGYRLLCSHLHKVRWHIASQCLNGNNVSVLVTEWQQWLESPVESLTGTISFEELRSSKETYGNVVENMKTAICFTCGECSSGCPVFNEKGIFDPRWIFRMVNFGLIEHLLKSPSIWLCIDCQRCSDNCSQNVVGHRTIQNLRELAIEKGFVAKDFPYRWQEIQKTLYLQFLEKIDALFCYNRVSNNKTDGSWERMVES